VRLAYCPVRHTDPPLLLVSLVPSLSALRVIMSLVDSGWRDPREREQGRMALKVY